MKSIEISARTVAEAVELALAQLGKDRDEVAIAVLESGDEALVRVTVVDEEGDESSEPSPGESADVQTIACQVLDELLARMDIHAYVTPVVIRVPGQKGDIEESVIQWP